MSLLWLWLTNSILSSIVLLLLKYFKMEDGEKIRLAVFGLLIWLTPYHLLGSQISVNDSHSVTWLFATFNAVSTPYAENLLPTSNYFSRENIALLLLFVGSANLMKLLIQSYYCNRKLHFNKSFSTTTNGTIVNVTETIETAFTQGLINPQIWINRGVFESDQVDIVIEHELTHIKNRDNYIFLLSEVIRHLFWWNPIIHFLNQEVRVAVEARCDRQVIQCNDKDRYLLCLSHLALTKSKTYSPLNSHIFSTHNQIINRIKRMENKMNLYAYSKLLRATSYFVFTLLLSLPILSTYAQSNLISTKETLAQSSEKISFSFEQIPLIEIGKLIQQFYGIKNIKVAEDLKDVTVNLTGQELGVNELQRLFRTQLNLELKVSASQLSIRSLKGGLIQKKQEILSLPAANKDQYLISMDYLYQSEKIGGEVNSKTAKMSMICGYDKICSVKTDVASFGFTVQKLNDESAKFVLKPGQSVIDATQIKDKNIELEVAFGKASTIEFGNKDKSLWRLDFTLQAGK